MRRITTHTNSRGVVNKQADCGTSPWSTLCIEACNFTYLLLELPSLDLWFKKRKKETPWKWAPRNQSVDKNSSTLWTIFWFQNWALCSFERRDLECNHRSRKGLWLEVQEKDPWTKVARKVRRWALNNQCWRVWFLNSEVYLGHQH